MKAGKVTKRRRLVIQIAGSAELASERDAAAAETQKNGRAPVPMTSSAESYRRQPMNDA